jgi:exosortase A-associated hydrolase 2
MVAIEQAFLRPVFIERPTGPLFGVHVAPGNKQSHRSVLYVPPFAEEMNRSRRMAALQARAFAARGISTLLLDLSGTGDSAGDFGDARLSLWLDDLVAAADWLAAQGDGAISLWGLRFGALLAAAAAAREPDRFKHLLFWHPVIDGKAMLTQFLRIRVAAAMAEGAVEKTEDLRAELARGVPVEIAGYELSMALAEAIDGLHMGRLALARDGHVDWLDVAAEAGDRLLPGGERVVAGWREAGMSVFTATVAGEPFWTLQETTLVPALLAATNEMSQRCTPSLATSG